MPQFYGIAGARSTSATLACDCLAHRFGNAADHGVRACRYPTDMSDAEWAVVRPLLPVPGNLVEYGLTALALVLAIVKRSDGTRGFVVLPKPWIVERFFAHLMRSRRLVRDFERSTGSAEAMVHWSMTLLMTRRLARPRPSRA